MAEVIRNVLIGATVVTAVHLFLTTTEGMTLLKDPASRKQNATADMSNVHVNDTVGAYREETPSASCAMPLDGLKEMFEFATNRESWKSCDIAATTPPTASEIKTPLPTRPMQVGGNFALVNEYQGEDVSNGGIVDGISGFDGWDTAAQVL